MANICQSVKTVDLLCLIDEEQLDPYGVGNLLHILTIHIWSQRKSWVHGLLMFKQSSSLFLAKFQTLV